MIGRSVLLMLIERSSGRNVTGDCRVRQYVLVPHKIFFRRSQMHIVTACARWSLYLSRKHAYAIRTRRSTQWSGNSDNPGIARQTHGDRGALSTRHGASVMSYNHPSGRVSVVTLSTY